VAGEGEQRRVREEEDGGAHQQGKGGLQSLIDPYEHFPHSS